MKKKNLFLGFGVAVSSIAIALSCIVISQGTKLNKTKGEGDYYTITFGASDIFSVDHETSGTEHDEYYETGTKVVKTDQLQNDVTIGYENTYRYDFNTIGYFQMKNNGGSYIYNVTPINSIVSLRFSATRTTKVEWGWDKVGGDIQYVESDTETGYGGRYYDFDGYHPNYFRVSLTDATAGQLWNFQIELLKDCVLGENPNVESGGLRYKKYFDGLELQGYSGTEFDPVVIPSQVGDRNVIRIAAGAFEDSNTITDVTIPNTVEYIGNNAFYSCDNLANVTFETGGSEPLVFGNNPFGGVTSLTGTFVIPKRMANSVGQYTLDDMKYISAFEFEDGYSSGNYFCADGIVYYNTGGGKELYVYPQAATRTSFTVPSDIISFNDYVGISANNNLKTLIFENANALYLNSFVIQNCQSLEEIQFNGAGAVTLEWYPFAGCYSMTSLVLPANTVCHGRSFGRIGSDSSHPVDIFFKGNDISAWSESGSNYNGAWYDDMGAYAKVYLFSEDAAIPVGDLPAHITGSWHYVGGVPTIW